MKLFRGLRHKNLDNNNNNNNNTNSSNNNFQNGRSDMNSNTRTIPFVSNFTARPNGVNVLDEYKQSLNNIVIAPELMEQSLLHKALSSIPMNNLNESFDTLLKRVTSKVFSSVYVFIPEIDYNGDIYRSVYGLYNQLRFERPYLYSCIKIIYEHNTQNNSYDQLRIQLGLLGRAYNECSARKRMAFSVIIRTTMSILEKADAISNVTSNKDRIKNICIEYLDEIKEKAFYSAFLEPTIVYFDFIGDSTNSGDVEVHGSNTYLTLIEATTGIKLPRIPLLDDEVKGVAEFKDAFNRNSLAILYNPINLGKSSRSFIPKFNPDFDKYANSGMIFQSSSPSGLARLATTNSITNKNQRMKWNEYLIPFTNYFSALVILPRLFTIVNDSPGGIEALQEVFNELKDSKSNITQIPQDVNDVRYWLWNEDIGSLNYNAIQEIFSLCGVTKPLNS